MAKHRRQGVIIRNLNAYLDWHNLPSRLRLNPKGVCHGLSLLYIKYVLEGKGDAFFERLDYMAGKEPSASMESEVNQFVIEVLKAASPELWNPVASQALSHEDIKIDGLHALSPAFFLGLVTSKAIWADIFDNINLQVDEVMLLSSINHSVVVSRLADGDYAVYDPNSDTGLQTFATTEALMNALQQPIFGYADEQLGLDCKVFSHPASAPRTDFPNVTELYENPDVYQSDNKTIYAKQAFTTLDLAIRNADSSVIEQLVTMGQYDEKTLVIAAVRAMICNAMGSFAYLLGQITQNASLNIIFFHTLKKGNIAAYKQLLDCHAFDLEAVYHHGSKCMQAAAQGGNVDLLEIIGDVIKTQALFFDNTSDGHASPLPPLTQAILSKDRYGKDAIMYAIEGVMSSGLETLLRLLKADHYYLSNEKQLDYLLYAIKQNHPKMVECLISALPQESLQTIELSLDAMRKASEEVLWVLSNKGVKFDSFLWHSVMAEKKHQPPSILTLIGIKLLEFVYFLQKIFLKKAEISHHDDDVKKYSFFMPPVSPIGEQPKEEKPTFNAAVG